MKLWPWSVLAEARGSEERTRVGAENAIAKVGNLWQEVHKAIGDTEAAAAAADYRIPREAGEQIDDYRKRVKDILHDGRHAPVANAILDFLDGRSRAIFRTWLTESDKDKAEEMRQRASELADTRSALVLALFGQVHAERRKEQMHMLQEHRRIYQDMGAPKSA